MPLRIAIGILESTHESYAINIIRNHTTQRHAEGESFVKTKLNLLLCLVAAATLAFHSASASAEGQRYIVMANSNAAGPAIANAIEAGGGTVVREISQLGMLVVESGDRRFIENTSRIRGVAAVAEDALIEFDSPRVGDSLQIHGTEPGNGFLDGLTWGVETVGAPAAWAAGNKGAGVRVAVLDAGIDHDHPDLAAHINAAASASYVPCLDGFEIPEVPEGGNCDGDYEDWRIVTPGFNHGTHVAGTIAATGDLGVTGVAPEAEIMVVKVCTEFFNACFTSSIIEGLVHAADNGADLANMSLGGLRRMRNDFVKVCKTPEEDGGWGWPARACGQVARFFATGQDDYVANTITIYRRAFEYASQAGVTVILSSGNSAINSDTSKDIWLAFADFPHTIAVNALGPLGWCLDPTTSTDEPASYTNYGQSTTDFAAPGGDFDGLFMGSPYTDFCAVDGIGVPAWVHDMVLSTINNGWGWAAGTSMAAPHATGVAALLISANGGPMSPAQVEQALKANADDLGKPGHDAIYGAGRVHSGH